MKADIKWIQTDLNRRPPTCEAGALPTELWTQNTNLIVLNFDVGVKGIDRNWARMSAVKQGK